MARPAGAKSSAQVYSAEIADSSDEQPSHVLERAYMSRVLRTLPVLCLKALGACDWRPRQQLSGFHIQRRTDDARLRERYVAHARREILVCVSIIAGNWSDSTHRHASSSPTCPRLILPCDVRHHHPVHIHRKEPAQRLPTRGYPFPSHRTGSRRYITSLSHGCQCS